MITGFLLGVIATSSLTAGMFFLKFWRRTHDGLFLAFGAAFLIDAFNRITLLFSEHPNEANPVYYLVRLFAFLLILIGILRKNYGKN
jgi:Family of unknown function (DUF5985)